MVGSLVRSKKSREDFDRKTLDCVIKKIGPGHCGKVLTGVKKEIALLAQPKRVGKDCRALFARQPRPKELINKLWRPCSD